VNATSAWTRGARDVGDPGVGGTKCCPVRRAGTAVLLHTQKVKIKYKKPRAARPRSANYGGTASSLNRCESLRKDFPGRRRQGGGGAVEISTGLGGATGVGLMRRFFFLLGEFSGALSDVISGFRRPLPRLAAPSTGKAKQQESVARLPQFIGVRCSGDPTPRGPSIYLLFFRPPQGRGAVKCLGPLGPDRWGRPAKIAAKFRNYFFGGSIESGANLDLQSVRLAHYPGTAVTVRTRSKNVAKFRVGGVAEGCENLR
jgi:hypothetical protein